MSKVITKILSGSDSIRNRKSMLRDILMIPDDITIFSTWYKKRILIEKNSITNAYHLDNYKSTLTHNIVA